MKKNFGDIGNRNSNMKKGKDLLFSKPEISEENTLTPSDEEINKKEKLKYFNIPLPASWHEELKYEIAKDTGKSVKELILDALAKTYDFK